MNDRNTHRFSGIKGWLLERPPTPEGPVAAADTDTHPWWKVLALTGVDYYSTLGYLPGIALITAGSLAPIATLFVVILTLFGVLPVYRKVAVASPHGQGSVVMIEKLLGFWRGKLLVLTLIGFILTAWIFTITVSAADATAHVVESPFTPSSWPEHKVLVTLALLSVLAAIFLKGFREVVGVALSVVVCYLTLTAAVTAVGLYEIFSNPIHMQGWWSNLRADAGSPFGVIVAALIVFPQLALGLSGFETGVGMMPHIHGSGDTVEAQMRSRIRNTKLLLTTAALIMSVYLITTSIVTTLLVDQRLAEEGGIAEGRTLSWVAHTYMGDGFGAIYDVSTIAILWFAGASAMAGLLNIVPRYLPRYGMAPEWATIVRPLVLVYIGLCVVVTIWFSASVEDQAGAYATGVLATIISASFAVALLAWKDRKVASSIAFSIVTAVLIYALIANEVQRPDGIVISLVFVAGIVVTSFASRVWRTTELRVTDIELDELAQEHITRAAEAGGIHLLAHRPRDTKDSAEYARKVREQRENNRIPRGRMLIFLEIERGDPSEFKGNLRVTGHQVGNFRVLRASSPVVPNSIAALLLYIRENTKLRPHCYFGWSEVHPVRYLLRYVLFGEGDTAPLCREVLRSAEPDPAQRPTIHVAG